MFFDRMDSNSRESRLIIAIQSQSAHFLELRGVKKEREVARKGKNMEWLESMPKVELHAHLNGSIRNSTLLELARNLGDEGDIEFSEVEHVILKDDRSLVEVFKLFDLIHVVTTDHEAITRITKEVIEDFASENVVYIELRTTPKRNDKIGMSKRSYMEAVMQGVKAVTTVDVCFSPQTEQLTSSCHSRPIHEPCNDDLRKKIYVRFLLSIDRRESAASAMETVDLALGMREMGVVGIDLSGNPTKGEWVTFIPALEYARKQGLKISLHCGEVPNRTEINGMLDFHPDRVGHACCLNDAEFECLKTLKIPVEICLTSNIRTGTISSIDIHHFADLHRDKHPMVLCTDDAGVFSTSLSGEYKIAASTFGIKREEVYRLASDAVHFIFADDGVKTELRNTFMAFIKQNLFSDCDH
ncbi:hypothetical protein MLD38_027486 [Melastoma candidum]|uniref:Uncharacterized protein n=1 Tax=Melastoma candidum TaxID=119954 RepID=A0ACB9P2E0_9MYRT|nr:hypothetical protein MLD38_027486 [Melastoma candidum]